jgi:hypothetical protein
VEIKDTKESGMLKEKVVAIKDSKDIMNLPGKVTRLDDKVYQWEPAETLEIDPTKFHPQASK